ncbi:Eco57I restriction-modification methylase domain-containing protein [Lactobacillus panisapium]|uniref:Type II methyltransferase M.TaqI-like domain-containing protein n=1 Tax=Lactobacillus panisapium TaxID=2012495 RepID=A0ABX8W431_9LACO|nr:Eco57I restriction-modification methylase domain-containing protein [Lactobacillus panisapium]QYN52476.1 hypothetical protein GYM71_03270 [Lactobacillus panisapium]
MDSKEFKFDVVIGNPPYHEETNGAGRQAKPLYNLFVEQIEAMGTPISSIIMPSRWFAGGMGLDKFRDHMMNDLHIKKIVDYPNSKEVFSNTSIGGGVCYFVRNIDYSGPCDVVNVSKGKTNEMYRSLREFPVLVRYNEAVSIIRKVLPKKGEGVASIMSSLMPFGLNTCYRGEKKRKNKEDLKLYASGNSITYIKRSDIKKGEEFVDKYKVIISKTGSEHAGEPDKHGMFKVIPSTMRVINPGEVCTHSYFVAGQFDSSDVANNLLSYLKTKFVRFLVLQSMSGIGLSRQVFTFVPIQDFNQSWNDQKLYKKYSLTEAEIGFVESMIKEMD